MYPECAVAGIFLSDAIMKQIWGMKTPQQFEGAD
jgi:hypothetical protein